MVRLSRYLCIVQKAKTTMVVSREGFIVQYTDTSNGKVWYVAQNAVDTDPALAKVYIRKQDADNMCKKCTTAYATSRVLPVTLTLDIKL